MRNSQMHAGVKARNPVAEAKGIVEIIMLLQGHHAARVRSQAAELLVRYLGGDVAIIDEYPFALRSVALWRCPRSLTWTQMASI